MRHVIGRIDLGLDEVAGLEVNEAVGTGAHGLEVVGRFPRLGALVRLEDMPGKNEPGHRPERRGLGEGNLDGVGIEGLYQLDVLVAAHRG